MALRSGSQAAGFAQAPTMRCKLLEAYLYFRAKLECMIAGAVWPLIWWISDGFRPPRSVATEIRTDSTVIRHPPALPRSDSTLFRQECDIPVVNFRIQAFTCKTGKRPLAPGRVRAPFTLGLEPRPGPGFTNRTSGFMEVIFYVTQ